MFGTKTHASWPIDTIGNYSIEMHYGTSAKAGADGDYVYIRMNNITDDGILDLTDTKRITLKGQALENATVRHGDMLFNRTNSIDKVGKTCVFHQSETMVIAGYIVCVRFADHSSAEYVSGYLNSKEGKRVLRNIAKGSVHQANISAADLAAIPIAIPPLSLQQEFAGFAAEADKSQFIIHQEGMRRKSLTSIGAGGPMYSMEQKRVAIEAYIRFGHSCADTIAELGYPSATMLRAWWREYESTGAVPERKARAPRFTGSRWRRRSPTTWSTAGASRGPGGPWGTRSRPRPSPSGCV